MSADASRLASGHSTFVLITIITCYAYRDVWPIMTYTLSPLDSLEGSLLWVKVALATISGIILPVFQPYDYDPVDPAVSSLLCTLVHV
jgi:hypothetical protein